MLMLGNWKKRKTALQLSNGEVMPNPFHVTATQMEETFINLALPKLWVMERRLTHTSCAAFIHSSKSFSKDSFVWNWVGLPAWPCIIIWKARMYVHHFNHSTVKRTAYCIQNLNWNVNNATSLIVYGCVFVPWHFEFYILKYKKFKM